MEVSNLRKILSLFLVVLFASCAEEEISNPNNNASLGFWIGNGNSSQVVLNYPDWSHDQELEFSWASNFCNLNSQSANGCTGYFNVRKSISSPWQVIATDVEGLDLSKQVSLAVKTTGGFSIQTSFDPNEINYESSNDGILLGSDSRVVAFPDPANGGINTMWMIGGKTGIDIDNNISKSTDGIHWHRVEPLGTSFNGYYGPFYGYYGHEVAVMPDPKAGEKLTMWTIGGVDLFGSIINNVFKSADGVTWEKVEPVGEIFSPRAYHSLAVMPDPNNNYKNTLWIFGGVGSVGQQLNDVWKSTDGTTWAEVKPVGNRFEPRYGLQVKVMPDPNNNNISTFWLISGAYREDVWKSTDGIAWERVTGTYYGSFRARQGHQVVVMKDEDNRNALWLIGGFVYYPEGPDYFLANNDIWKSYDGANWEKVNTSQNRIFFAPRGFHQVIVMADPANHGKDSMWIIGGRRYNYFLSYINDAWKSADGINFSKGIKIDIQF